MMTAPEKFYLRTENQEGKCTVYVNGELDLESASQMRAAMAPLVELTDRELALNLRELRYIDSTGIGILVSVLKARHAKNAPFVVEAIPTNIRKLFDMTGITPFLLNAGTSS
ncbi:anti-sigma-factor antagonist [Paenibacillus curdlanolyticus YK9]|uniref:Anti-sigma factor antagonist n=1 Tax=Paenibacillus curdlanolyticus YK9 TaxID=717606 RepID=E0I9V1_9BACL|nr:STAS domain-containing protein [Paenibacillus curdlanolyticus]EFM10528.1 anti-sigma-factor antagonist [Paenibacillus curdlanolyticus YK9]